MCVWPPLRAGTEDMMGARSTGTDGLQHEVRHGGERTGVAGADHGVRTTFLHQVDGQAHGGSLRRRMASRGCSDMPTTLAAGWTLTPRAQRGRRAGQRGLDDLGFADENELEGGIGGESAQGAGMHSGAPQSPLITSTAIDAMRHERTGEVPGRNSSSVSTSAGFSMTRLPR